MASLHVIIIVMLALLLSHVSARNIPSTTDKLYKPSTTTTNVALAPTENVVYNPAENGPAVNRVCDQKNFMGSGPGLGAWAGGDGYAGIGVGGELGLGLGGMGSGSGLGGLTGSSGLGAYGGVGGGVEVGGGLGFGVGIGGGGP